MRYFTPIILLALGGCQFAPKPELTAPPLPDHFSEARAEAAVADPQAQWWRAFGDATLDGLIAQGVEGNLDMAQARDRIAAAEAQADVANAGTVPSLTFGLSSTADHNTGKETHLYPSETTSGGSLSAAWLIDFFGQTRSQYESASALAKAELAGRDAARLTVISNISKAYIDQRYYEARAEVVAANLAAERRTLELTERLKAQAISSELDVSRVRQTVDQIAADLPTIEANRLQAIHRIATLMGKPATDPPSLSAGPAGQPVPLWSPQAGVPADLLRNRPDIAQAEREFASAMADIGYAWSQFFPSVTLSGSVTPSYIEIKPTSGNLTTWSFAPSLRLPIFDGGAIAGNYRAAIARAYQKRDAWRAAVLGAVEDVENALTAYNRERVALATLVRRVQNAQKATTLAHMSYEQGMTSLLDVLDAQRSLYDAQAALAQARRDLAIDYITLNVAVGRGFQGPGQASYSPQVQTARRTSTP